MKKKALSLMLVLVMCLGLTVPAHAAGSDFVIEDGVLAEYNGSGGNVTIPSGVTGIGNAAFSFCSSLTAVTIPSSVTGIGDGAFSYCTGLTSVTVPSGVTWLGWGVFGECTGLTSVTLPSSINWVEGEAFMGCTSLTDIYYGGTEAEWNAKELNWLIEDLKGVTVHYNSTGPAAAPVTTAPAFSDVKADAFYAKAVAWAVEKNITNGTSATTFSPNATCTQGQILTFLWRAKGEPAPAGAVTGTKFYAKAAQWADEQDLADDFSADAPCTRAMVVTYLWKLAGSPKVAASNFTDVSAGAAYAQAVAWAVEKGITNGSSATTFSPDATCTRGQIVTFLYRAFA